MYNFVGVLLLLAGAVYYAVVPSGALKNLSPSKSFEFASSEFQLRSVHHHNVGAKYKTYRKLDYTRQQAREIAINSVNKGGSRLMMAPWINGTERLPNITDRDSLVTLAQMSSNAYVEIPNSGDWEDLGKPWLNETRDQFGWMDDGVRGYVFANEDEDIIVISIKGTSALSVAQNDDLVDLADLAVGISDTTANDKTNDNLLFSCCCARVSYFWKTVCDCYEKSYTCNENCLENELRRPDRYYQAVLDIYSNVSVQFPHATVWVTGHSLGGSLAALLARTYGLAAVTFQAPSEKLAAQRLHLPLPPGAAAQHDRVWHFGNTADPIFMGQCNGASSTCSLGGYAMETQCHSGYMCVYDTVSDFGWPSSIYYHRIKNVIAEVLMRYNETAKCTPAPSSCQDCFNWEFTQDEGKYHSTDIDGGITATHTSPVPTDTREPGPGKCKKYNWYGKCIEWALSESFHEPGS